MVEMFTTKDMQGMLRVDRSTISDWSGIERDDHCRGDCTR